MKNRALFPALLLVLLFAFEAAASEASLEGVYNAAGSNPGGRGSYEGSVTIIRTGETYKIVWNVGSVFIGTGIVVDEVLSVAYTDENKKWFGFVAYRILNEGRRLEGIWGPHGGKALGSETLTKR